MSQIVHVDQSNSSDDGYSADDGCVVVPMACLLCVIELVPGDIKIIPFGRCGACERSLPSTERGFMHLSFCRRTGSPTPTTKNAFIVWIKPKVVCSPRR